MANPKAAAPAKAKAERYQVRLVDASGYELQFKAQVKDGKATSYAFHRGPKVDGKRQPGQGRGATQAHPDFATASKAVDAAVALATKAGWARPARGSFGGARPDAFDLRSIPAPKAGK